MARLSPCAETIKVAYNKRTTPLSVAFRAAFSAVGGMAIGLGYHALAFSDIPIVWGYELSHSSWQIGSVILLGVLGGKLAASGRRWSKARGDYRAEDIRLAIGELNSQNILKVARHRIPQLADTTVVQAKDEFLLQQREKLRGFIDEREDFQKKMDEVIKSLKGKSGRERIDLLHKKEFLHNSIRLLDSSIVESEGKLVGKYLIRYLRDEAEGGMGKVYIGYSEGLDKEVIVKVVGGGEDQQARLQREAEIQSEIFHPNVARIYSFREVDGEPAIVQEWVRGEELSIFPKGYIKFHNEKQVYINIMLQIARGLKASHDKGVIHRDLKPGNILVVRDGSGQVGRVVIIDFGLGRSMLDSRRRLTMDGSLISGTPPYMSPEQWGGLGKVERPTDIYALGCIFFELISGIFPYQDQITAENAQEQRRQFEYWAVNGPVPVLERVEENLQELISKMLQKGPSERPNIDGVIAQLQEMPSSASSMQVIVPFSKSK